MTDPSLPTSLRPRFSSVSGSARAPTATKRTARSSSTTASATWRSMASLASPAKMRSPRTSFTQSLRRRASSRRAPRCSTASSTRHAMRRGPIGWTSPRVCGRRGSLCGWQWRDDGGSEWGDGTPTCRSGSMFVTCARDRHGGLHGGEDAHFMRAVAPCPYFISAPGADCPQRERRGWLGDAQLSFETVIMNIDGGAAYTKVGARTCCCGVAEQPSADACAPSNLLAPAAPRSGSLTLQTRRCTTTRR